MDPLFEQSGRPLFDPKERLANTPPSRTLTTNLRVISALKKLPSPLPWKEEFVEPCLVFSYNALSIPVQ